MKKTLLLLVLLAMPFIMPCGGASTSSSSLPVAIEGMSGYIQKGPFILGSTVTLQVLDSSFLASGAVIITDTIDDFGSFDLSQYKLTGNYAEVSTAGFYFNEVTGAISTAPITLWALAPFVADVENSVNVNLLTTLSKERTQYLVTAGDTFSTARSTAQKNILDLFYIPTATQSELGNFDEMDLSQAGSTVKTAKSNSILLALSAILQTDRTPGELSEFVAKIINSIKTTGTTTNAAMIAGIVEYSQALDYREVSLNLNDRYVGLKQIASDPTLITARVPGMMQSVTESGTTYTINWTDYFSWDYTTYGKLNGDATTTNYGWSHVEYDKREAYCKTSEPALYTSPMIGRTYYPTVTFDDKVWVLGGYQGSVNKNDVWSTYDGVTWILESENTSSASMWSGRQKHTAVVYDGRIYVIGGTADGGVVGDIWYYPKSASEKVWAELVDELDCPDDITVLTEHQSVAYGDKIYIFGGRKTGAGEGLNTMCSLVPATITWADAGNLPAAVKGGFGDEANVIYGSIVFNGKLYMLPGAGRITYTGGVDLTDYQTMYIYDWTSWTTADLGDDGGAIMPRGRYGIEVFDSKLWVLGGDKGDPAAPSEDVTKKVAYMDTNGTWSELDTGGSILWSDRNNFVTGTMQDKLWVIGGFTQSSNYVDGDYDGFFYSTYANRFLDCESTSLSVSDRCWLAKVNCKTYTDSTYTVCQEYY